MFALTVGSGTCLGSPDVCLTPTPAGPVPVPYPNIAVTANCPNAVLNILMESAPTINAVATIAMSNGNEAGSVGGVASHLIDGQCEFLMGSMTVMVDGTPLQRLTSTTGQNCMSKSMNAPGTCLVPSQYCVLVLS